MGFVWDRIVYLKILLCSWLTPSTSQRDTYIIAAQVAANGSAFKVRGLKNLLFSSSFFSSIPKYFLSFQRFFLNILRYSWLIWIILEPFKTFLEGFARFCCKFLKNFTPFLSNVLCCYPCQSCLQTLLEVFKLGYIDSCFSLFLPN